MQAEDTKALATALFVNSNVVLCPPVVNSLLQPEVLSEFLAGKIPDLMLISTSTSCWVQLLGSKPVESCFGSASRAVMKPFHDYVKRNFKLATKSTKTNDLDTFTAGSDHVLPSIVTLFIEAEV